MLDMLSVVTQTTSSITFVLIAVALSMISVVVVRRQSGDLAGKSMLLFSCFLLLFLFAVGFMSLYHWLDSDAMELAWYLAIAVSLGFGVASELYALRRS